MKYTLLIIGLLSALSAFAQPNREELALRDEEAFDLSFRFQYEDTESFAVTFTRKDKLDFISITKNECNTNNINRQQPIVDRYIYEQLLDYLQDINVTSFQPTSNNNDENAKLLVQGTINISRTWTMNAFVFNHNPDNIGEESQILEFVVDVLLDNATDDCNTKFAEQLSIYVNGEE